MNTRRSRKLESIWHLIFGFITRRGRMRRSDIRRRTKFTLGRERHWRRPRRPWFDTDRLEIVRPGASHEAIFLGKSSKKSFSAWERIKWLRTAGHKSTFRRPLHCLKNGVHLRYPRFPGGFPPPQPPNGGDMGLSRTDFRQSARSSNTEKHHIIRTSKRMWPRLFFTQERHYVVESELSGIIQRCISSAIYSRTVRFPIK
jgi:hypothetical protein